MTPLALALLAAAPPPGQAVPPSPVAPAPSGVPELGDPMVDPAQAAPRPAVGDVAKQPLAARALETAPAGALTRPHPHHAKGDPLEGLNRQFFALNATLDHAIFRPAAMGYKHVVPKPVRSGFRNFFSNLMEPVVFLNYLLQLKPGKAAETLGRFALNSTAGLAGAIDIAKRRPFHLPHRDNGFGSTLGRYGVGPGPYLYLPFVGPTTLRDLVGSQADRLVLPFTVQQPPFDKYEYQIPKAVITGLDARAEADDELKALFAGAVDPYATLRSVFLQNRAGEIAALRHPHRQQGVVDPLRDPGAASSPSAPAPADPLHDPAAPTRAAPPPAELDDPLTDPGAPAPAPVAAPAQPPAAVPATPARR